MEWTKEYCGLQHLGEFSTKKTWVTVRRYDTHASLSIHYPGSGFGPTEHSFDTVELAKAVGEQIVGLTRNPTGEQMNVKHLQYSDKGYGCCFPVCGNGRLVPGGGILNREDFIKAIADGTACPLCEQLHNQFEKHREEQPAEPAAPDNKWSDTAETVEKRAFDAGFAAGMREAEERHFPEIGFRFDRHVDEYFKQYKEKQ